MKQLRPSVALGRKGWHIRLQYLWQGAFWRWIDVQSIAVASAFAYVFLLVHNKINGHLPLKAGNVALTKVVTQLVHLEREDKSCIGFYRICFYNGNKLPQFKLDYSVSSKKYLWNPSNKSKWQGEIKFLTKDKRNVCIMQILVWKMSGASCLYTQIWEPHRTRKISFTYPLQS